MDNDNSMDRLLKRTLRARRGGVSGACLDAETLAAWSDGSLSAHERAAVETHAADCERCLTVLATIAKTMPIAAPVPWWTRALSVRWLVPATAAAAAVAVWVAVQRPESSLTPAPTSVAKSTIEARREEAKDLTDRVTPQAASTDSAQAPSTPSTSSGQAGSGQGRSGSGLRPSTGSGLRDQESQQKAVPKFREMAKQDEATPARERTEASAKSAGVGGLAGPPPMTRGEPSAVAQATPPPPPPPPAAPATPTVEERRDQFRTAEARDSLARSAAAFRAPSFRWRIANDAVERSVDEGRSWQAQTTGATTALLAGSSPSPAVFWAVGREGTIMLTTDGRTWRRVTSPASVDLVSVTATDASTATVTTADGRTFRTADAGQTWTPQENPTAPF